jgi:hypothetical protein
MAQRPQRVPEAQVSDVDGRDHQEALGSMLGGKAELRASSLPGALAAAVPIRHKVAPDLPNGVDVFDRSHPVSTARRLDPLAMNPRASGTRSLVAPL